MRRRCPHTAAGVEWVCAVTAGYASVQASRFNRSEPNRDPFDGPPEDIASTRVLQTFVEGERVYAAADA
jgi:hypothetical protein